MLLRVADGHGSASRFTPLTVSDPPGDSSPINSKSNIYTTPRASLRYDLPTVFDTSYNQSGTVTSFVRDELLIDSGNPETNRVNLQNEIDLCASLDGHTRIRLETDWENNGPIICRVHDFANKWTYIEWANKDSVSAGEGFRARSAFMSTAPILGGNGSGNGAVWCDMSADYYRFVGIRFQKDSSAVNYRIIFFSGVIGSEENAQLTEAQSPTHMFLDRCWVDGENDGRVQNGVVFNCRYFACVDSVLDGMWADGFESHAFMSHNSPGPWKIDGCEIESASINLIIGGLNPHIPGLQTYDGLFRRNWVHKRTSWNVNNPLTSDGHLDPDSGQPSGRVVKNLFELKWGRRILIECNVFEYNWSWAQQGAAICFKTENSIEDGAPGGSITNRTSDIIFRDNIVRHSSGAIEFIGRGYGGALDNHTGRIELSNNLFHDIAADIYAHSTDSGVSPRAFMFSEGANNIYLKNNTFTLTHLTKTRWGIAWQHIFQSGYTQAGLDFENNVFDIRANPGGSGTIYSSGHPSSPAHGTATLDAYSGGDYTFSRNVLTGALNDAGVYPSNNEYPDLSSEIMFVDHTNGDFRLAGSSPYKNYGLDGNDPGCDFDVLDLATDTVVTGL
jgi:hypothetical protein